jgi:hypothetical protein
MVGVIVKGAVEFRQYCDVEIKRDVKKAAVAHFNGPLTVGVQTTNWKVPAGLALKTGDSATDLRAWVGTMDADHGCWVVVKSDETFPSSARPVAQIEFPAVKRKYSLDKVC